MSPIATRAPWAISATAVARPIPRPPPVIAMVCPASERRGLAMVKPVLLDSARPRGPMCGRSADGIAPGWASAGRLRGDGGVGALAAGRSRRRRDRRARHHARCGFPSPCRSRTRRRACRSVPWWCCRCPRCRRCHRIHRTRPWCHRTRRCYRLSLPCRSIPYRSSSRPSQTQSQSQSQSQSSRCQTQNRYLSPSRCYRSSR